MSADEHRRLYDRWLRELWHGHEAVAQEIVTPGFTIHQVRSEPGEL
jgi:hypothetical protein